MPVTSPKLLLVNPETLLALHQQLMANKVGYGLNSKAVPITCDPGKIKTIDCSGLVRYLIVNASATKGFPDGSWHQNKYFVDNGFESVKYADQASLQDDWLRIAFIAPAKGKIGHVWLIHNGQTIESRGGKGPDQRSWNTPVLSSEVTSCYKLGPMPSICFAIA